jgi:hypothetical protein
MVLALVAQLRVLIATLHQWQAEISQLFAQHPDAFIFASFPAAGPVLAPRLQTAFGSRRDRFGDRPRPAAVFRCGSGHPTQRQIPSGASPLGPSQIPTPEPGGIRRAVASSLRLGSSPLPSAARPGPASLGRHSRDRLQMGAHPVSLLERSCPYGESKYLESLQRRNPQLWEASQQPPPPRSKKSAA